MRLQIYFFSFEILSTLRGFDKQASLLGPIYKKLDNINEFFNAGTFRCNLPDITNFRK